MTSSGIRYWYFLYTIIKVIQVLLDRQTFFCENLIQCVMNFIHTLFSNQCNPHLKFHSSRRVEFLNFNFK
jgi:hypothetical protein